MSDPATPVQPNAAPAQHSQILVRSSLSLLGTFLYIIRRRFSDEALDDFPWTWVEEPNKTQIVVELGYNEHHEKRGVLPGIFVGKSPTSWNSIVVGDRSGSRLASSVEAKYVIGRTSIVANVVSDQLGECFQIADVLSHLFLCSSDFIRKEYRIRDVYNIMEGTPTPYPKETKLWQLPVSVDLEFSERWLQQEEQNILESMTINLPEDADNPEEFYQAVALGSLADP